MILPINNEKGGMMQFKTLSRKNSQGFWGLAVYFKVLVGFKAVEEEVDFVDAFIDMPMAAIPRFIINRFLDFIEPLFCACINCTLVDTG